MSKDEYKANGLNDHLDDNQQTVNSTSDSDASEDYRPIGFNEPIKAGPVDTSGNPVPNLTRNIMIVVGCAIVSVMILLFLIYSNWNSGSNRHKEDLANAWIENQNDEASGVFFSMKLKPYETSVPELELNQNGLLTMRDTCFESSSRYMVMNDGSIAVESLLDEERLKALALEGCEKAEAPDYYSLSKIAYSLENSNWVAYDSKGKDLNLLFIEAPTLDIAEMAQDDTAETSSDNVNG